MAQHQAGGSGMGSCGPPVFCTLQGGNAMHDVSTAIAIGFVEQSKRLRAAHYRAEAERFRGMAETEPLRSVRRHFQAIASEYEHMAAACVALRSRSLRERP